MHVTKQQQLEWLVSSWTSWHTSARELFMSKVIIGCFMSMIDDSHQITLEEWQQERDKMQKQQDNSLSKRGSCPPVGEQVELWFGGSFAYDCEFICMRGRNYIVWNLDADRPDCADIMNSEFRPLRTEREKAIDDMKSLCAYPGSWCSTFKAFAESLYDAGYRKQ